MAMTLAEKFTASEQDTEYRGRVMGALLKHAKYVKRASGQSSEAVMLAQGVINNPSDRVFGFAFSIITEPIFDDIDASSDISDNDLMNVIPDIWTLFLP